MNKVTNHMGEGVGLDGACPNFQSALAVLQQSPRLSKVAILLCTHYGQHYLAEQLESFATQTHSNWEVWASDDDSRDGTRAMLESYQDKWGADRLSIHAGPAEGFVANFLSLTCKASIEADYYAYSDQDDIWEADKLERAVSWLQTIPAHVPSLYCSRTRLVDAAGNEIGLSPLFTKPPSFSNALVQNIGGGNTMVMNRAARRILIEGGANVTVVSHDWWVYMVVAGCGGQVFYDSIPSLRYRQHASNLVGANVTFGARVIRLKMLLMGRFRHWNDVNIEAVNSIRTHLTSESRDALDCFSSARRGWLWSRLLGLKRSGIHRQTLLGNIGLIVAALLGKL